MGQQSNPLNFKAEKGAQHWLDRLPSTKQTFLPAFAESKIPFCAKSLPSFIRGTSFSFTSKTTEPHALDHTGRSLE